ncbi:protein of unknown function [Methylocaldum szegediense]|uniref:Uncharacterized protein n=1 Tax=Methylocaldum szegediense TaxID=73780 RepID=A0ABM9I069_9GAMM|nr:protein of unknown function [Methylocaldum szegediense]
MIERLLVWIRAVASQSAVALVILRLRESGVAFSGTHTSFVA